MIKNQMSFYVEELRLLNIQERKVQNERNILAQQIKFMREQLTNLQVEKMQLLQTTNNIKKVLAKCEVPPVDMNTDNMDNESEINTISISLNSTNVLKDMLRGQFTAYKNEDSEEDDD